jgi:DNA-binding transcriptional LysR family regulator
MIDDFFSAANVKPNVTMELSRQEAINQMVENNLGVGLAGAKAVSKEVREGRLISWLIEGAEIKWELGLARLRGAYIHLLQRNSLRSAKRALSNGRKS